MSIAANRPAAGGTPTVSGLSNFRDFGAQPTASGRRVVAGRFFRSASPAALTPAGFADVAALGIGRVVDLRGRAERAGAIPAFPDAAVNIVSTPVEPKTDGKLRAMLADGTATRARLRELMIGAYRAYVTENAGAFGAAIEAIVLAESPAVLVHCTAGKDRTGFIVALLQRALAVPEDVVIADYLRTNADWDRASVAGHLPLDHDGVQAILAADADYLAASFEEISRQVGSVTAFVHRITAGRVDDRHLSRLVEKEAPP